MELIFENRFVNIYSNGVIELQFGKYYGQALSTIDDNYINWVVDNHSDKQTIEVFKNSGRIVDWVTAFNAPKEDAPQKPKKEKVCNKPRVIKFGKYQWQTFEWIKENDYDYLVYLIRQHRTILPAIFKEDIDAERKRKKECRAARFARHEIDKD